MIDATDWHGTVTLQSGVVYDDPNPVLIRKDILIAGPEDATVNSEIQVYGGATVEFRGFTFRQNKPGAPMMTGNPGPMFAQNAHVQVRSAQVYFTDTDMYCDEGATQNKPAIEVISGSVNFRSSQKYTRIRYERCNRRVFNVYYGSYMALFGNISGLSADYAIGVVSGSPVAINVASSTLVANATYLWNWGEPGSVCVNLARASRLVFGSGVYTTVNGFATAYSVVEGSEKWVGPTSSPQ
jgi:hypothetical protein